MKDKRQKKNLSVPPKIIEMGEKLAIEDKRDFSSQVSWLIEQEHARRFGVPPRKKAA
jgi:hypothetical protein